MGVTRALTKNEHAQAGGTGEPMEAVPHQREAVAQFVAALEAAQQARAGTAREREATEAELVVSVRRLDRRRGNVGPPNGIERRRRG